MSVVSDLYDLNIQHENLERELAELMAHPAASDAEIAEIKRKKLKLKDKIAFLSRGMSEAA